MTRRRFTVIAFALGMSLANSFAQGITFKTDSNTGAISELGINNDTYKMNWVLSPDGTQYKWVTGQYGWGLGFLTVNGEKLTWQKPIAANTYKAGNILITVKRKLVNGELFEEYSFKNTGKTTANITDWGIYTPWNDNYPSASECIANRYNTHIWADDNAAYAFAVRMGDKGILTEYAKNKKEKDKNTVVGGGNVGLMLTKGSLPDYEEWERKKENANSNFRGVFAMDLPDMTLAANKSYTVAWKVFEHKGKNDFYKKLFAQGGAIAKSDKYVYQQGETVKVYLEANKLKSLSATVTAKNMKNGEVTNPARAIKTGKDAKGYYAYFTTNELEEQRIDLIYNKVNRTHANILVVSNSDNLIGKRVNFIIDHQQMNDPQDARYGAYTVYDNEKQAIYKNDDKRKSSDTDEGRERVGMGIMLAKWYLKHPSEKLKQSLIRYAKFYRERLQTDDYTTYSTVSKSGRLRGYNYTWAADFSFHMYEVTKDKQYAIDGYQTMQALYRNFGYGFYCIDIPVTSGLKALRGAGLITEYNQLLIDFSKTADVFIKNGLNFPKHEVNFEQSVIAPATQFLLELYLQTQDKQYLQAAENMLPVAENLCGGQPDYRLNEIPIRHWDCYWFGKRQLYGDTFPHYWSCINGAAYYYYAKATGKEEYLERAKEIVRNNLCNVFEDGTGSCAFVYPKRINGEKAHFADAFANDQDWALVFYLWVNE